MSDPAVSTDKTRPKKCRCGTECLERELHHLSGATSWKIDHHNAPCGLPCMAGGVPGKAYREKQVHGAGYFSCPRCGTSRVEARP